MTAMEMLERVLDEQDQKQDEKNCSWLHAGPVKAEFEAICLGCGKFSGFACVGHEKYLIDVQNSVGVDGKLICRKCLSVNKITFVPLS